MGTDGLSDLDPALQGCHLLVAADLPGVEFEAVEKSDRVVPPIDAVRQNHKAVGVFVQLAGESVQVVAALHLAHHGAGTGLALNLKTQAGRGGLVLVDVHALHIDETIGGGGAGQRNAQRRDLFDEVLVVGIHRVQAVHHVVFLFVGGRIAQGEQGVELFQAFFGLFALHALRFINDQDGVGLGDDVDGAAAAEAVQLFVDDLLVFAGVESLHIDDHGIDTAIRGKVVHFGQLVRGVGEKANFLAVLIGKMLLGRFQRFGHALPDGHRGHHYNKFAPAVAAVELVHGFDVGVSFASAGLHLDGQVDAGIGQSIGWFQIVTDLHRAQVL